MLKNNRPYLRIIHKKNFCFCFRGSLFTPEEALKIGLIDEIATDKADAIAKCENYIQFFNKIPSI